MYKARIAVLYGVSLANDLFVIPLILIVHVLWGENLRWEGHVLCTNLKAASRPRDPMHRLPLAGWYAHWAGTTFGHAIMYGRRPSHLTRVHEHVHVHQMEGAQLKGLLLGLLVLLVTGKIGLAYLIWFLSPWAYLVSNWLVAILRGVDWYLDSAHEEHAYLTEHVLSEMAVTPYEQKLGILQKYI